MKVLVILNPISGTEDKTVFIQKIKAFCKNYGVLLYVFRTTGFHDEADIKLVISEFKPDKVVSVGGDGTILLTATVLKNTDYPMGIVPLGSANGMAMELGIKPDPFEAFKDILLSNFIMDLDMVEVNGHDLLHIGDVGANANIVAAFANDEHRGLATYAKYLFEELNQQEAFQSTIQYEDKIIDYQGIMIAICNARKYGTGVPLNTISNPWDGKFELVIVQNINFASIIKAGFSTWDDKFIEDENRLVISTKEAKITFDKPRLLQLDGEVIEKFDQLSIKIQQGCLKLLTTQENMERHHE